MFCIEFNGELMFQMYRFRHDNVEKRGSESETASDTSGNTTKYRSVISDVFDGRLLSSVQCLTCDRVRLIILIRNCTSITIFVCHLLLSVNCNIHVIHNS